MTELDDLKEYNTMWLFGFIIYLLIGVLKVIE